MTLIWWVKSQCWLHGSPWGTSCGLEQANGEESWGVAVQQIPRLRKLRYTQITQIWLSIPMRQWPHLVADDQMVSIGYVFGSSYRRRSFNQLCPLGAVQKVRRSLGGFKDAHHAFLMCILQQGLFLKMGWMMMIPLKTFIFFKDFFNGGRKSAAVELVEASSRAPEWHRYSITVFNHTGTILLSMYIYIYIIEKWNPTKIMMN